MISDSAFYKMDFFFFFENVALSSEGRFQTPCEHVSASSSRAFVATLEPFPLIGFLLDHEPKPLSYFSEFLVSEVAVLTIKTSVASSAFGASNLHPHHMCC